MIAESFGFVQFPILPLVKQDGETDLQLFRRNPKLCTPRDFDYSPYFEIIKYPFMDFSHHSTYRLLPWHGNTRLQGDESDLYLDHDEEHSSADVDQAIEQALLISENASGSQDLRESITDEDPEAGVPEAEAPVETEQVADDDLAAVSPAAGAPEAESPVETEQDGDDGPGADEPVDEKDEDTDPLGNF
jgi:hypothetical protein